MKKVVSLIVALVLSFSFVVPAFATQGGFVPSITVKPAPELVIGGNTVKVDGTESSTDPETVPVIEVKNESKDVVYTAPVVDLVVTAVSQVQAEDAAETLAITEEAVVALKEAYTKLNDENFKLSEESAELQDQVKEVLVQQVVEQLTKQLEEQGAGTDEIASAVAAATDSVASNVAAIVDTAVVTALFDVSILSEELDEYLNEDGHTIDLTFKADIPEEHHVVVMVFKENKWQTIENVIVNDDGTITCTFAHFCPVAILTVPAVEIGAAAPIAPVETPDGSFAWWWIVLIAVVVVVVIIVVVKNKNNKKNAEVKK